GAAGTSSTVTRQPGSYVTLISSVPGVSQDATRSSRPARMDSSRTVVARQPGADGAPRTELAGYSHWMKPRALRSVARTHGRFAPTSAVEVAIASRLVTLTYSPYPLVGAPYSA